MKTQNIATLMGGIAVLSSSAGVATAAEKQPQQKPNILLIIADDCSYYTMGCYGAENNVTPNIDQLAKEGIRFTNAYNSVSMSTPTRHCTYTGMYPMHHGGHANHSRINPGIKTMPVYMSELGYRVGLAGKWHINPQASFPFENIPGFPENCVTNDPSHTLEGVTEFMTRDQSQPFCMVLASINPHAPWTGGDPSKYDVDKLKLPANFADTKVTRERYAAYLAEVDLLDEEVGQMVDILKKSGQYDNTIIMFISEQGTQFAGAKWTNWYPGVHAAMIAKWKGQIKPGSTTDAIVQYEDILPTFMTIAGGQPAADMDGRNMIPVLTGKTKKFRDYAFHSHSNIPEGPAYPIRAITDGHYRLIWNLTPDSTYVEKHVEKADWLISWREAMDTDPHAKFIVNRWYHRPEFELYDIKKDNFELNNLADNPKYAKIQAKLYTELQAWMKQQNDPGAAADVERKKPQGNQEE